MLSCVVSNRASLYGKTHLTLRALPGFNWNSLAPGTVVLDCGGGVGSVSLPIVRACPQIQLIVQDTAPVVAEGPIVCNQATRVMTS